MVVQILQRLFVLLIGLCLIGPASTYAQPELNASVDRNKIYASDTLNLRVVGNFEMEMSFGGILNFGRNQVGSPDTSALEQDFEILDQQQSYNMQSINGKTTSQVTWTYTLAPKRTGELSVPAIEFKGTSSQPIPVTVLPGTAPRNAENPPNVFLEVEVDKDSVYVQEQIVFTLRLYAADQLASGDLSEPAPADAIVEGLGDIKKFFRMAYNQRYEVRERKFLIFPQKSGTLEIEPQSFSGILIDTRSRRRVRVRELSEALSIEVKSPPSEFSGDIWLPATSLHLTENWEQAPNNIQVGDSLTRTIEIQSLGLLGSALPPIAMDEISGIKVYPDQPEVESLEHETGVQSIRKETTALVAVDAGSVNLPEIRIPWWDTVNDVERLAVIPSRRIEIRPGPETANKPAAQSDIASPQTNTKPGNLESKPISDPSRATDTAPDTHSALNNTGDTGSWAAPGNHILYTLIGLLAFGWISTSIYLIRQLQRQRSATADKSGPAREIDTLKALEKALKQEDSGMPRLLLQWAAERYPDRNVRALVDLAGIDTELMQQAQAFEARHYGGDSAGVSSSQRYDKNRLLERIEKLEKIKNTAGDSNKPALMPFYP
ncbi:MAG: protein BatD [Oleiphilus sp.]|nr:MAG: protein BatD [Oleiphilus sp.]